MLNVIPSPEPRIAWVIRGSELREMGQIVSYGYGPDAKASLEAALAKKAKLLAGDGEAWELARLGGEGA